MIINPAKQVHGEEEIQAGIRALKSGFWAEGAFAENFKKALCKYLGVKYTMLTNSGSSANLAALMALTTHWIPEDRRLKKGDEIITTALCFPTTVSPILIAGCVPVFVDVDSTWNINIGQVVEMITPKTKAIMVAHNLGSPFDANLLRAVCNEYNLWLIEDNCDALSSRYKGRLTGTFGDVATSSFYPAHHISCGEGGAVYTSNSRIYRGLQSTINWGRDCWCLPNHDNTCNKRYSWQLGELPFGYDHKNTYTEIGFNLKMTDIQAAIGTEQLKRIDDFAIARKYNHQFLTKLFANYQDWFELHRPYFDAEPSWFGYVVKLKKEAPFARDDMVKYLDKEGIRSRAFFCGNITKQPLFTDKKIKYRKHKDLTVSDDLMNTSFWIGCHPGIKKAEREYMKEVITNFLNQY